MSVDSRRKELNNLKRRFVGIGVEEDVPYNGRHGVIKNVFYDTGGYPIYMVLFDDGTLLGLTDIPETCDPSAVRYKLHKDVLDPTRKLVAPSPRQ